LILVAPSSARWSAWWYRAPLGLFFRILFLFEKKKKKSTLGVFGWCSRGSASGEWTWQSCNCYPWLSNQSESTWKKSAACRPQLHIHPLNKREWTWINMSQLEIWLNLSQLEWTWTCWINQSGWIWITWDKLVWVLAGGALDLTPALGLSDLTPLKWFKRLFFFFMNRLNLNWLESTCNWSRLDITLMLAYVLEGG
jgi:hypothetical protein